MTDTYPAPPAPSTTTTTEAPVATTSTTAVAKGGLPNTGADVISYAGSGLTLIIIGGIAIAFYGKRKDRSS